MIVGGGGLWDGYMGDCRCRLVNRELWVGGWGLWVGGQMPHHNYGGTLPVWPCRL